MYLKINLKELDANVLVGPFLTVCISAINFLVNYYLPKNELIKPTEIIGFTQALLIASSISSIYFLNKGSLVLRASILNSTVLILLVLLFRNDFDIFSTVLFVIFILLDLYKFQGRIDTTWTRGKSLVSLVILLTAIIILLSWNLKILGIVYLIVLSFCVSLLRLPSLSVAFTFFRDIDDFYYLIVVLLNQVSVYFLLIWTASTMTSAEFLQYRSDMSFLAIGGLVGTVVLSVLTRIDIKMSGFIVLLAFIGSGGLILLSCPQYYLPALISSSIYHGFNRAYLKPITFLFITSFSPVVVTLLVVFGLKNIFLGLTMVYLSHTVISYLFHLRIIVNEN